MLTTNTMDTKKICCGKNFKSKICHGPLITFVCEERSLTGPFWIVADLKGKDPNPSQRTLFLLSIVRIANRKMILAQTIISQILPQTQAKVISSEPFKNSHCKISCYPKTCMRVRETVRGL